MHRTGAGAQFEECGLPSGHLQSRVHDAFFVTGRPVYVGETSMERLVAHREQETPSLLQAWEDIASKVDNIFQKMVVKFPEDRYQSMEDVVVDMQQYRLTYGHRWMIKRFIAEQKLPKRMGSEIGRAHV